MHLCKNQIMAGIWLLTVKYQYWYQPQKSSNSKVFFVIILGFYNNILMRYLLLRIFSLRISRLQSNKICTFIQ